MLLERESILERLHELARDSRRGHGRLALVTGEAGIGKTSVVAALVSSLGRENGEFLGILGCRRAAQAVRRHRGYRRAFRRGPAGSA